MQSTTTLLCLFSYLFHRGHGWSLFSLPPKDGIATGPRGLGPTRPDGIHETVKEEEVMLVDRRRTIQQLTTATTIPLVLLSGTPASFGITPFASPEQLLFSSRPFNSMLLSSANTDAVAAAASLLSRLDDPIPKQLPAGTGAKGLTLLQIRNGIVNLYLPDFMEGTWNVTQILVNVSMPLGPAFAGGPSGSASIGQRSLQESQQRLLVPVELSLRYVRTPWGVAEDRLYNTRQRLNAFAGRTVVATVDYADLPASNRAAVLAQGGTDQDPLTTTVIRFKGPAAQKTFLTGHDSAWIQGPNAHVDGLDATAPTAGAGSPPLSWIGYETQRSIFALTNENPAPPILTDTELVEQFTVAGDDPRRPSRVTGRLRIVGYLNPNDQLYFDARKRAVSIQDYLLDMIRLE